MIQIIPKSEWGVLWTTHSKWANLLGGEHSVGLTDTFGGNFTRIPVPIDCTVRRLTLSSKNTRTFNLTATLYQNGSPASLTTTLLTTDTIAVDETNSVSLVAGDDLCALYSGGLVGANTLHTGLCLELEGDENVYGISPATGSIQVGKCWRAGALGNGAFELNASVPTDGQPRCNSYSIAACAGTITKICLKDIGCIGVGGGFTAYIRLNTVLQDGSGGTVDTSTLLVDGDPFVIGSFSLPIALADSVELVVKRTGTNAASSLANIGASVAFTPTTDGEFMCCGGNNNALSQTLDLYEWVESDQLITTETLTQAPAGADFVVNGLYVEVSDPVNALSTMTGTFRIDSADTDATVTIAAGDTTASITGLSIPVPTDSFFTMLIHPAGLPSTGEFHWGLAGNTTTPVVIVVRGETVTCLHGSAHNTIQLQGSSHGTMTGWDGSAQTSIALTGSV